MEREHQHGRDRCARSEDDQDTRFCHECLSKPCRWFGGWRPGPCDHKFVDSTVCLKCGEGFAPPAPPAPEYPPPEADVPEDVARELGTACNDVPTGKTQDHFKARRVLFQAVDSQIRARVKAVLPEITLEFKQQIDRDLGLDALRKRVQTLAASVNNQADQVSRDAGAVTEQFEALVRQRVEQLFEQIGNELTAGFLTRFTERAQAIVAKEVGLQMTRLLMQPPTAAKRPPPSVERRVRVKKKRTTRG